MNVVPKEITVFRFPQYSAAIDQLPGEEKAKMDTLAYEIADSFIRGDAPILAFVIIGHADRDAQGPDFEMQVSLDRSEAAQSWLVAKAKTLVQQSGRDPAEVDMAEFSLFGQGASNLYTQNPTFPEREKNRRVVIKYGAVELDPAVIAGSLLTNLARARLLMAGQPQTDATQRVICALDKLADPQTDDTYFHWSTLQSIAGGLRGLSDNQILTIARSIILSFRQHIANNNLYGVPNWLGIPYASEDIVVQNLLAWEQGVRDTRNRLVERIAIEGAAAGQVHKSVARYIARNEDNQKSILSCFKGTW